MTRLLQVEYFKLRKRMMTWILAAILVGLVLLLYSVLWSVSGRVETFGDRNRFTGADLRRALFLQASVPFLETAEPIVELERRLCLGTGAGVAATT